MASCPWLGRWIMWGPMTRTVLDNALMLGAIAGHDPNDPNSARMPVPEYTTGIDAGVQGLRIGIDTAVISCIPAVVDSVRSAIEAVIDQLASLGADIIELNMPELEASRETQIIIRLVESASYHRRRIREKGPSLQPGHTRHPADGRSCAGDPVCNCPARPPAFPGRHCKPLFQRQKLDAMLSPTIPLPAPLMGGYSRAAAGHAQWRDADRWLHSSCLPRQCQRPASPKRARRFHARWPADRLSADGAAL